MKYPGFISGSYESASVTQDQERTVNFYVENMESSGATSRAALYPTPGVETIVTATTGPGRAHFAEDGREWAVIGTTFYEITEGGTLTSKGTVAIDANPAMIASNGQGGGELFITSGSNGYNYDIAADTLTQISALDGKATQCDQLDGYFLVLDAPNATLFISDLLDGATWDATQFAQRSIASDPWVAMKVSNRYIWLFGTHTSEVWYDAGTSPFPFAPHPAGLLPYGCAAAFSPAVAQGSLVWLARSKIGEGMVLRATGFTPERISTYPVQSALQEDSAIADAIGDTYDDLGHTFYLLTVPAAGITWQWDSQTQLWAERGTWLSASNAFTAWRPRYHAFEFGEHRWLDAEDGTVHRSSVSLGTDVGGGAIRRLRRAPVLNYEKERMFYSAFELDLETGLGAQTGQGADPQVMMRLSNDGGRTWGVENLRSAGKAGQYLHRVRWNRLGAARQRVFEISISDPIPVRITDAYLEISQPPKRLSQIERAQWGA